jgi:hypothetical protein
MSAVRAVRVARPLEHVEAPTRHLDVAPTRAQRRARPRVYAALVAVGGIVAILLAQLLMSIVLADGAYRITSLQRDHRDLAREQNAAQERLDQLSSTQSLINNAAALGMVSSGNPVFLDVATGQALGTIAGPRGQAVGGGGNLIGNALIDDSTMLDPAAIAGARGGDVLAGTAVSATQSTNPSDTQTGVTAGPDSASGLPSPTTR